MQISKSAVVAIRLLAYNSPSAAMSTVKDVHGVSIILSPAKTLDLTPLSDRSYVHTEVNADVIEKLSNDYALNLCDKSKTNNIIKIMKDKSEGELKSLLKLSPALAKSSHDYWAAFDMSTRNSSNNFGVFTFSGPAYHQGIIPQNCNLNTLTYLAKNLYILDPVYGVLRGMDKMQPYRLEMGCKGIVGVEGTTTKGTLATYWKDSITSCIGSQLLSITTSANNRPILVNLASEEYSSAVDIASLPRNTTFLNVVFRHKGRVVAVHAKRARGLMARYIAERGASSLLDISKFNLEGYGCICVGESSGEKSGRWETKDVVGENVQIVNMMFDRDDVPVSEAKIKRKDDSAVVKSSSKKTRK